MISGAREATASAAVAFLTQNAAVADTATWVVADNADPASPGLLIAAAKDRFGGLDGTLIRAQEFGRVAAFLRSPAASFMTGGMIPVDGGAIRSI